MKVGDSPQRNAANLNMFSISCRDFPLVPAAIASFDAAWAGEVALGSSAAAIAAEILWCGLVGQAGRVAVISVLHIGGHRLAQEVLYFPQVRPVLGATEGNGVTIRPSTSGAPDTMYVSFGLYRKIVVDHVGDIVHIQSSRSHIGGDEYTKAALLEALQCLGTRGLALVAVYGHAFNGCGAQLFHYLVCGVLHLCENKCLRDVWVLQEKWTPSQGQFYLRYKMYFFLFFNQVIYAAICWATAFPQ